MARTQRELTPDDLPIAQMPAVDLTHGMASRGAEDIVRADKPLGDDYANTLAFMEEEVTIRLEHVSNDQMQKPVLAYPFSVNGRTAWVPTDRPWKVKRKFLEVILRSQPFSVATESFKPGDPAERNLMHRYASRRYPVSILHDPNPKGAEWHQRVALEG